MANDNLKRLMELTQQQSALPAPDSPPRGDPSVMSTVRQGQSWLDQAADDKAQLEAYKQRESAETQRAAELGEQRLMKVLQLEARGTQCWATKALTVAFVGVVTFGVLALISPPQRNSPPPRQGGAP